MTHDAIETAIREALARLTDADISTVSNDQDLAEAIGLDSLGRLELLAEVEDRFDLFFPDAETESAATIGTMVATVERALNRKEEAA